MYTILITEDNYLQTSIRSRIMQGSKNVDSIRFLTKPFYNDVDLRGLKVILSYILPVSKERKTLELIPSEELYKERIEYIVPVDENFTSEIGNIKIFITFKDDTGDIVRETSYGNIFIEACDEIKQVETDTLSTSPANNIYLDKDTNELYLTSDGDVVGNKISLDELGDTIADSNNDGLVTVITE